MSDTPSHYEQQARELLFLASREGSQRGKNAMNMAANDLRQLERESDERLKRFERCNEERERQHTRTDNAERELAAANAEVVKVREHFLAKCETAWQRADEATARAMRAEYELDAANASRNAVVEECAALCDDIASNLRRARRDVQASHYVDMGKDIRALKRDENAAPQVGGDKSVHGSPSMSRGTDAKVDGPAVAALVARLLTLASELEPDDTHESIDPGAVTCAEAADMLKRLAKDAELYRALRDWPIDIMSPDWKPLRVVHVGDIRLGADAPTGGRLDVAVEKMMREISDRLAAERGEK